MFVMDAGGGATQKWLPTNTMEIVGRAKLETRAEEQISTDPKRA